MSPFSSRISARAKSSHKLGRARRPVPLDETASDARPANSQIGDAQIGNSRVGDARVGALPSDLSQAGHSQFGVARLSDAHSGDGQRGASLSRRVARVGARNRRWRRLNAGRRGGQALILAVFIMLFAALLSSTFLVLVAANTQTIGRSIDKTGARHNADEGSQAARRLMASSTDADTWQPEAEPSLMGDEKDALTLGELPPAPGDPTYDQYWTPLDKAMGWTLTTQYTASDVAGRLNDLQNIKRNGGHVYVKVPDPRFSREATRFMLESRLLASATDEVTDGGDKKWMLRVTSIGMSPQNSEVWARQLLYKATNLNGGTFSYANFVSNYDFDKDGGAGGFATARLSADAPSGTFTLPIAGLNTFGPNAFAPGQTLMLSDGIGDPFTALIARRDTNTVTLKLPLARAFAAASTTVSMAATLTSGLTALNDNGARTTLNPNVSTQRTLAPQHNEVSTVAGATTDATPFGNGSFYNLGLKIGERAEFKARPPYARSWGTYQTYSGQNALTVTGPLDRSSAGLSFFNAADSSVPAATPPALDAAQNKYFRLSFTPAGAMQVDKYLPEVDPLVAPRPVNPASLDIAQYKSRATNGGALLDYPGDFEKLNGTALSNPQLQRLWQRKSFAVASGGNINYTGTASAIGAGTTGLRLSWPRPGVDGYAYPMSAGSLEQRGVRGWISPWEFLPRGALLELKDNQLVVTTDALDDAGNLDPTKKFASGSYSSAITIPANGIICATGNLRVRGNWNGRPLTIVSGHNIYIEGALTSNATGKIALLAKDNVTLNPTQFLQRPAGLTDRALAATPVTIAAQSGATVTLAPGNVGRFKIGDAVALSSSNQWVKVTGISGDTLALSSAVSGAAAGLKLRQMTDPQVAMVDAKGQVVTDASAVSYAYALGKNSDNLYRGVLNDGGAVNVGLRQAAERIETTFKTSASTGSYYLQIKRDFNSNSNIDPNSSASSSNTAEMTMQGSFSGNLKYSGGGFSFNLHNLTPTTTSTQGDSKATLSALKNQFASMTQNSNGFNFYGTITPWELVLPASSQTTNPYGAVPIRRLAAFDAGALPGGEFKVPLTTSVGLFWNNVSAVPDLTYGSFWGPVATELAQNRTESVATVKAAYYGNAPQWNALLAQANPTQTPLASLSLQRDIAGDPDGLLPRDYIAGLHLEGGNGTSSIAPVYSPRIQATIYAQTGSWFVIPMPAQTTDPTNPQAGRWRRSFYKVAIEGNIAQNFSPTAAEDYDVEPDPDGMAVGATKRWLDSLAYPATLGTDGSAGDWQTISYTARALSPDDDLALPTTADVLYTYAE